MRQGFCSGIVCSQWFLFPLVKTAKGNIDSTLSSIWKNRVSHSSEAQFVKGKMGELLTTFFTFVSKLCMSWDSGSFGKVSPYKHEDISSNPRSYAKFWGHWHVLINAATGR